MSNLRRRVTIVSLIAVVMLSITFFSLALSSCSSPEVSTSLPPAEPSFELPVNWKVDGVINPGEYDKSAEFSNGSFRLSWVSDGQYILVGMRSLTNGWVSVGFDPEDGKKNADIILGYVQNGKTYMFDMFSTGRIGPHRLDTELGGTNDILVFAGREEGGYTTIEFARALKTNDSFDKEMVTGVIKIIWAYGPEDSITALHLDRGYGQISL